jgi:threonine dehydratase
MVALMIEYDPIPLEKIKAAQRRIADDVFRTPLVRLNVEDAPAEIYLKLETLQPIRSFKIRGACNALKLVLPEKLRKGVWTASAGNWAQGVAWYAQRSGIKCTIVVPDHIPKAKEDAIKRMGAAVVKDTMDAFVKTAFTRQYPGQEGYFVHPFSDPDVMAGAATIGLEILEDLPDADTILVPWGGGGLACGIASALRALRPEAKVYACEVATAAPLAASLAVGEPLEDIPYKSSFVDGIGAPAIWPEMFDLAGKVLDGSLVVELEEVSDAIRLLAERNSVIAEGAGAASVAAALTGRAGDGKVVCVVSGGNIDASKLVKIFKGKVP